MIKYEHEREEAKLKVKELADQVTLLKKEISTLEGSVDRSASEARDAHDQLRENAVLLQTLEGELKDKRRELTCT